VQGSQLPPFVIQELVIVFEVRSSKGFILPRIDTPRAIIRDDTFDRMPFQPSNYLARHYSGVISDGLAFAVRFLR
jgi:hypothetical protein